MTVTLTAVLDQLVAPTDPDLADASRGLARGLVAATPAGCEVAALLPAGPADEDLGVAGLADIRRTRLGRRELVRAWQAGVAVGVGGMIHSPTLLAPLVKHDRVHDNDQTVVTLWDLRAWTAPGELPRSASAWQRAMLRRAVRYADAVVVPTHSMAARLGELAPLGGRIRVIAGAPPSGFAVPPDAAGRARTLALPPDYIAIAADLAPSSGLAVGLDAAARVLDADGALHVIVMGAEDGTEPAILDLAASEGIPERRIHVRGRLSAADRAVVLAGATALLAPARQHAFPWRVLEALELGTPVVAAESDAHRDVLADGGVIAGSADAPDGAALGDALLGVLADATARRRLSVLARDRARSFSWREAADRVWQLHADL